MVADDGTIIDGHERHRAIVDLGLRRFPMRVVGGLSDAARREMAVRLNIERRHLTATQRRLLIEAELRADPGRSNCSIGNIYRCSHNTVDKVRRRMEAGGQCDHVPRVGRDGKVYRPPSVGVETLSGAREAARLLPDLGDDVEGNLTMRDARKAAWAERLKRANDLPAEIKMKIWDFRRCSRSHPGITKSRQ